MWPFDDDEEDLPAPQPATPVTPEQRQRAASYVRDKYLKAAGDGDRDIAAAQDSARNQTALAMAIEGIGQIATAGSAARGGPSVKAGQISDRIGQAAEQRVADARQARKDKMDAALGEDRLEQQEKERERKGVLQGREDEQYTRQKKDHERTDAQRALEDNAESQASRDMQSLAERLTGAKPGTYAGRSATELKGRLPTLEKIYELEQRKRAVAASAGSKTTFFEYTDKDGNIRSGKRVNGSTLMSENDPIKTPAKFNSALTRDDVRRERREQLEADRAAAARVPGTEVMEGFRPSTKDTESVRVASESYENIMASLKRLDDLYGDSGTNLVGDSATEQEGLVTDIQMNLKELQKLGVLTGPDLSLLQKQVPDPTSFAENLKAMVGSDRVGAKSTAFRKTMDSRYNNALNTRGYHSTKVAPVDGNRAPQPAPGVADSVRNAFGGTANAAPAERAPEDMSEAELDAELERLRGGK